jgi:hypothetical protein
MSGITHSNLLIAAQLYGTPASAPKAKREAPAVHEFSVELHGRSKDKRPLNPTLAAPGAPKPLEPAKRFDEGAGRRDALPSQPQPAKESERPTRPGARLDIRV